MSTLSIGKASKIYQITIYNKIKIKKIKRKMMYSTTKSPTKFDEHAYSDFFYIQPWFELCSEQLKLYCLICKEFFFNIFLKTGS
jgi:hypothetical protein